MAFDTAGGASLEQFTLLAKNARGRACVALIQQVLSNKKLFVFRELLEMPNVQALQDSEYKEHYDLLRIFCFGTYTDYAGEYCVDDNAMPLLCFAVCRRDTYGCGFMTLHAFLSAHEHDLPELTSQQMNKLRKLTAVSLAHRFKVPYETMKCRGCKERGD